MGNIPNVTIDTSPSVLLQSVGLLKTIPVCSAYGIHARLNLN